MAAIAYCSYMFCPHLRLFSYKAIYKGCIEADATPNSILHIALSVSSNRWLRSGWGGYKSLFFISKSPYWFIRTYFSLFLISPLLNYWLDNNTFKKKRYLLLVLLFISVYGAFMGDESVSGGKNVVLFMFLYVLGDVLREKQAIFNKPSLSILVTGWIAYNVILVVVWLYLGESSLGKRLWYYSFPYSSPLLLMNAIWFFIVFSRVKLQSKFINHLAKSVFAIYILTEHSIVKPYILQPLLSNIYRGSESIGETVIWVVLFSLGVMAICILADMAFRPLFEKVQNVVVQKMQRIHGEPV